MKSVLKILMLEDEPMDVEIIEKELRRGSIGFISRRVALYIDMTVSPLRDERGKITHLVPTGKDITEQKSIEDRLNYVSNYDILTGLPTAPCSWTAPSRLLTLSIGAALYPDDGADAPSLIRSAEIAGVTGATPSAFSRRTLTRRPPSS